MWEINAGHSCQNLNILKAVTTEVESSPLLIRETNKGYLHLEHHNRHDRFVCENLASTSSPK